MTDPAAGGGTVPRRRRGRPSAAEAAAGPGTRERILASARAEFAERGFDRASVRAIARGAGVDPALVHHYFGTKEQVFGAAVESSFEPALRDMAALPEEGPAALAERLVRHLFGIWEDPTTRDALLALVRSAIGNDTAAGIFRDAVLRRLVARLTQELTGPDRRLRAELAAAQLVGTALLRYVMRVEPLASADVEQVVRHLVPVVRHHLTGGARDVTA